MSRIRLLSATPRLAEWRSRVDHRRRDLGLSQNQLAKLTGVNAALINRLLRGLPADKPTLPGQSVALDIALALGATPAETDRLLWLAGYAPLEDFQTRAEKAELALDAIRDALAWSERVADRGAVDRAVAQASGEVSA